MVRTLTLGHQSVGIYESRSRAGYWDGRNTSIPKKYILFTPRQELFQFHHGLDRKIRNHYQLWQDEYTLAEIGVGHPDDASGKIIEAVWDELRETEANDLGFVERPCVDCGEDVLVSKEEYSAWCYNCEKKPSL